MELKELMTAFGAKCGIEAPAPDEEGIVSLGVDDMTVIFREFPEIGKILTYAEVCDEPPQETGKLAQAMLAANSRVDVFAQLKTEKGAAVDELENLKEKLDDRRKRVADYGKLKEEIYKKAADALLNEVMNLKQQVEVKRAEIELYEKLIAVEKSDWRKNVEEYMKA